MEDSPVEMAGDADRPGNREDTACVLGIEGGAARSLWDELQDGGGNANYDKV
jgi:hypothetical protein